MKKCVLGAKRRGRKQFSMLKPICTSFFNKSRNYALRLYYLGGKIKPHPEVRRPFEGVDPHKSYLILQTVEHFLEQKGFSYKWAWSGALLYWLVLPALREHPDTGETVWFNQIQSHHTSHLQDAPRLVRAPFMVYFSSPLHPNISMHILYTILRTFSMVMIGRIC